MPVSTISTSFSYKPAASMALEAIPFQYLNDRDIVVTHVDAITRVRTTLGDTAYVITGDGPNKLGRVRALQTWPADDEFVVARYTDLIQKADVRPHEPLPAAAMTEQLDRSMMALQEQYAAVGDLGARALVVPIGETADVLPPAYQRTGGNKVLGPDPLTGAIGLIDAGALSPGTSTSYDDGLWSANADIADDGIWGGIL